MSIIDQVIEEAMRALSRVAELAVAPENWPYTGGILLAFVGILLLLHRGGRQKPRSA